MYERMTASAIERQEGDAPGLISGILVSDGEASDGHILNIDGAKFQAKTPLLFGHDDFSGDNNLGSWQKFQKVDIAKGVRGIRGTGQIELTGEGEKLAKRKDIAHMVDKGHIGGLSVRWDEVSEPVRRVNLPSDHPAFVDSTKETGRKAWGFFFDTWRLMEGSVVTLGADPAALIGRMHESEGDTRKMWRRVINEAVLNSAAAHNLDNLVAVVLGDGETAYCERTIYDAVLELANSRLGLALDLHEDMAEQSIALSLGSEPRKEVNGGGKVDKPAPDGGPNGSKRSPLEFDASDLDIPKGVETLVKGFLEALEKSDERMTRGVQQIMDSATGRVST